MRAPQSLGRATLLCLTAVVMSVQIPIPCRFPCAVTGFQGDGTSEQRFLLRPIECCCRGILSCTDACPGPQCSCGSAATCTCRSGNSSAFCFSKIERDSRNKTDKQQPLPLAPTGNTRNGTHLLFAPNTSVGYLSASDRCTYLCRFLL